MSRSALDVPHYLSSWLLKSYRRPVAFFLTLVGLPLGPSDADVQQVAVVVTRARFADGTVWSAPGEELIDRF
jgi:hypothetical protein